MSSGNRVPRDQFINKLRELGYGYKRSGKNHDIWKKNGGTHRVTVPRSATFAEIYVRSTLGQIGCDAGEIEDYLKSVCF